MLCRSNGFKQYMVLQFDETTSYSVSDHDRIWYLLMINESEVLSMMYINYFNPYRYND